MSGKPIVPSKDALRALRFLAQTPSAALLGMAGALCGVATLHYHERQKLHRVQAILETKRKIHTLSKGRGTARLASMFEAAEKGEDFTIRRRGCRKVRGRRYNSGSAALSQSDTDTTRNYYDATSRQSPGHDSSRTGSETIADFEPFVSKQEQPSAASRDNGVLADPSEPYTVKRIYQRLPEELEGRTLEDRMSWRHMRAGAAKRSREMAVLGSSFKPRHINQDPIEITISQSRSRKGEQPNSLMGLAVDQPLTDLNPVKSDSPRATTSTAAHLLRYGKHGHRLLDVGSWTSSLTNSLSSLQPWQSELETHEADANKAEPQDSDDSILHTNLYIDPNGSVPAYKVEHPYQSRYDLMSQPIRHGMSVVGVERYKYVFATLMNCRATHGRQQALSLLEQTMETYTTRNSEGDFALVQALFLDCTRLFSITDLKSITWRFVEKYLGGETPRLEVVSLLYPRCGVGATQNEGQHFYFLAHQYLEIVREKGFTLDKQVLELRKVLAGTHLCRIAPHEHLMIPVLRSLSNAGSMTSAMALFNEMSSAYKLKATFYSLQALVKGYARAGNWSKVKSVLDDCHNNDLSQLRTYGMSNLVVSIIGDYALSLPPERVIDFVMHTIDQYGVQPTSAVTRGIVSLCLRHQRYDLTTQWLDMVRTKFPHIDTGTGSSTFAYDVSCVWKDMDASCNTILKGCGAIAANSLHDPFSKVLRSTMSEAVVRYMKPRLQTLSDLMGIVPFEFPIGGVKHLGITLRQLYEDHSTRARSSRVRLLLSHLTSQTEALRCLNGVCRGDMQFQDVPAPTVSSTRSARSDVEKSHLKDRAFNRHPPLQELQDIMVKDYAQREKSGQSIDHCHLRDIANQLIRQGRGFHAFELIQKIYDSRWVQPPTGREFGIDLFGDWLRAAWDLRSGAKVRSVLWALIEAGPQLKLSSQIILLARVAAPKTHLQNVKRARTPEIDEIEYLRYRLKRRHWSTAGRGLAFDEWKGFGTRTVELDLDGDY